MIIIRSVRRTIRNRGHRIKLNKTHRLSLPLKRLVLRYQGVRIIKCDRKGVLSTEITSKGHFCGGTTPLLVLRQFFFFFLSVFLLKSFDPFLFGIICRSPYIFLRTRLFRYSYLSAGTVYGMSSSVTVPLLCLDRGYPSSSTSSVTEGRRT